LNTHHRLPDAPRLSSSRTINFPLGRQLPFNILWRMIGLSRFSYSYPLSVYRYHRIPNFDLTQMFSHRSHSNQREGLFLHYVLIPVVRILAWPITALAQHKMAMRDAQREDNRRIEPIPHSIPSQRRRRALTLSLPPKAKSRWTRSRSRSLLLSNLPLELRRIIWKESIGCMVLYVTIRNRKVVLSGIGPRDPHRPGPGFENWHLLAILLTCRQV
jgi:hypothetical protein